MPPTPWGRVARDPTRLAEALLQSWHNSPTDAQDGSGLSQDADAKAGNSTACGPRQEGKERQVVARILERVADPYRG
jgi:hypothetical protein